MSNKQLYILWVVLALLCAALTLVSLPGWVGLAAGVAFFAPPAVLVHRASRAEDMKTLALIQKLALAWLTLTLVLLVLNILSVAMSAMLGTVLYYLLAVLTVPMVCCGSWVLAIFAWACLFVTCLQQLRKQK